MDVPGGAGGDMLFDSLVNANNLGDDFDMLLPPIDGSSEFIDPMGAPGEWDDADLDLDDEKSIKTDAASSGAALSKDQGADTREKPPPRGNKSGITTKGSTSEAEKKAKRRKQIAAASRASRARRKRELEDLREENKRLRDERSAFLSKIGELQVKVESMRERGNTDMRVENALLRAQLEEHKRFVSHFKYLCDGAPTTAGARHMVYQQGSTAAHNHVLGLISQSLADNWQPGRVPPDANLPYQNFHFSYKYKTEYGEKTGTAAVPRQRLNVRVDLTFPGFQSSSVSDFMWNSFSNTDIQQRLYRVNNIELTQLADDMPDKDTKMVYFREKLEPPQKDQDWAVICNRNAKMIAKPVLALPPCFSGQEMPDGSAPGHSISNFFGGMVSKMTGGGRDAPVNDDGMPEGPPTKRVKHEVSKVAATVLAMSTSQVTTPQFENANRITSMFVQGAVTWDQGGDAKLIVVFSFPDDVKIKALERFEDIINPDGTMGLKFAEVLKELNEMLGEQGGDDFIL